MVYNRLPMTSPSHIEIYGHHGHQAPLETGLDFINTLENERGGTLDHVPTAAAALTWLREHDLLHRATLDELLARAADDPAFSDQVLRRLRKVRSGLRELLDATVEQRPPDPAALREVNRALRAQYVYRARAGERWRLARPPPRGRSRQTARWPDYPRRSRAS